MRAIEAQRRDLLGDEADEKHDHGEHDEQHGAVRNLAVVDDGVDGVGHAGDERRRSAIGRKMRSGLKIVMTRIMMRRNFGPSRERRIFEAPTRGRASTGSNATL